MKKINSKVLSFLVIIFLFLTSCQSIKDGLSGRKSENSDEFLVQKKNPLVMPPEFMKLPKPADESSDAEDLMIKEETDIRKILKVNKKSKKIPNKNFKKAEEFILDNIKQ
tara:strand:- start:13 stop:342 length:330 start_codon:yes stop_codon:yes gene_type:complete